MLRPEVQSLSPLLVSMYSLPKSIIIPTAQIYPGHVTNASDSWKRALPQTWAVGIMLDKNQYIGDLSTVRDQAFVPERAEIQLPTRICRKTFRFDMTEVMSTQLLLPRNKPVHRTIYPTLYSTLDSQFGRRIGGPPAVTTLPPINTALGATIKYIDMENEIVMPHLGVLDPDTITQTTMQNYFHHGLLINWPEEPFIGLEFDINSNSNSASNPSQSTQESDSTLYTPLCTSDSPSQDYDIRELLNSAPSSLIQGSTSDTSSSDSAGQLWEDSLFSESSASSSFSGQSIEHTMSPILPASLPSMEANNFPQEKKNSKPSSKQKRSGSLKPPKKKISKLVSCKVCKHEVAGNRDLDRHLITNHPKEAEAKGLSLEKLTCKYYPTCHKTFRRNDHLKRHLRTKHSGS